MERALPEAGLVRHLGHHLRVDQVRGPVVDRAHQRQEHTSHLLLVVARRQDGTHLLPGTKQLRKYTETKLWVISGGIAELMKFMYIVRLTAFLTLVLHLTSCRSSFADLKT